MVFLSDLELTFYFDQLNFLAHQYLSLDREKIRLGNFLGDFIKGSDHKSLDPEIAFGVILHRKIDWLTDTHELSEKGREVFRPKIGKYSGVALDLSFDHFLAKNWNSYSESSLEKFSLQTYSILNKYHDQLPERAKMTLGHMERGNWLLGYESLEGISWAFEGLSRRTKYQSNLDHGPEILVKNFGFLEEIFVKVFADTVKMAEKEWKDYLNK